MKERISNWGNYPTVQSTIFSFDSLRSVKDRLKESKYLIARGNGRCYGDSALAENIASTLRYNKFISFDSDNGKLNCQAGVLLSEIIDVIMPKGWFLPVTPGTKFITVGGAVACDVHGKNHHKEGSFSRHVLEISILCSDGQLRFCSRNENADLFEATCGGMGLTGIIMDVKFNLKKVESSYIRQKKVKAKNLDEIMDLFGQHASITYSMAWIDCLIGGKDFGRSIMMAGEHARLDQLSSREIKQPLNPKEKRKINVPFNIPSFVLNKLTVKAFNAVYYNKTLSKSSESIISYDEFFYPLDSIYHWNRMYGSRGFLQYQFVLPLDSSYKGLVDILGRIRTKGLGSFLAVLKLFGEQDDLISFPMRGYTLALDFPISKGVFDFLDELDKVVLNYGGRIYLTKDARMNKEIFWNSYPHLKRFQEIVRKYNPKNHFSSLQSERLAVI